MHDRMPCLLWVCRCAACPTVHVQTARLTLAMPAPIPLRCACCRATTARCTGLPCGVREQGRAAHQVAAAAISQRSGSIACIARLKMAQQTILPTVAGHVEIVKFLLQSGADKELRNKQDKVCSTQQPPLGQPPAHAACHVHHALAHPGVQPALRLHAPSIPPRCVIPPPPPPPLLQIPIDLCQPAWSNSYRFAREVLAEY